MRRLLVLATLAVMAGSVGYGVTPQPADQTNYVIKGNISIATGEHIYHVTGQRYCRDTEITPSKGERWFCSEGDARAAGWRKPKI